MRNELILMSGNISESRGSSSGFQEDGRHDGDILLPGE